MRLTHFGHACVVVEDPTGSNGAILIDPGTLAGPVDGVGDIQAVMVTHEHPDHIDGHKLEILRQRNPDLEVFGSIGTPEVLAPQEKERVTVLGGARAGIDSTVIAGWEIDTATVEHATIYTELPTISNNAYLIGNRVWHPGDAFVAPPHDVEVLLLPIGAPWLKLSEVVDFLRLVAPPVAIPIHQGGLAPAHRELHCQLLQRFAPDGTDLVVAEAGVGIDV